MRRYFGRNQSGDPMEDKDGIFVLYSNRLIELTTMERAALVGILVEYMLQPDSTKEWIDVVNDQTVTIEDLLAKVSR